MHAYRFMRMSALRSDSHVQAIRAQLQHALASGVEASASAYSQAAEEVAQDAERSIFENGAVNALYRLVACAINATRLFHAVLVLSKQFCLAASVTSGP